MPKINILLVILHIVAITASFLCRKIKIEREKDIKRISNIITVVSGIYAFISLTGLTEHLMYFVLSLIWKYQKGICVYVFAAALLPPVTAWIEKTKCGFEAPKSYALLNAVFNLAGALSACAMFRIAVMIIDDFRCLSVFPLENAVAVMIPLCTGVVLAYQSTEQRNEDVKHGTSTQWLNQKFNMLHLFHVYFLSFLSVTFIVVYTVYCYKHGRNLYMDVRYYFLLTLMLLYFYLLSCHRHDYLRLIFTVMVPVILTASMYWMSWFSMGESMRWGQWIFVVAHSVVYSLLFYIGSFLNRKSDQMNEGRRKPISQLIKEHIIIEVLILLIVGAYTVVWFLPLLGQRIGLGEASNYIMKICEGTDVDGEEMISKLVKEPMYDEYEKDFDRKEFLDFVSEELKTQVLGKGIIEKENERLQYENLKKWYVGAP